MTRGSNEGKRERQHRDKRKSEERGGEERQARTAPFPSTEREGSAPVPLLWSTRSPDTARAFSRERERESPPRALLDGSRRCLVFRNTHRSRRSPAAKVRTREARDVLPKPDFGPMRRPDVDVGTSRAWATTSALREFGAVHDTGREVCIAPGRIAVRHELHAQRVPQHAILRTTRVRKRHDTGKKGRVRG